MASPNVKPFVFENLERLTREQVELREGVLRYLPDLLPPEILGKKIEDLLAKYVRDQVQFELTALREPTFEKFRASIPDPTIVFAFTCVPLPQKAFLQVDFALANMMVDRMLGGEGKYAHDFRPATPMEEGILQYLILKILALLAEVTKGTETHFRLDRFVSEPSALNDLSQEEERLALLSFQVTVGKKAGFVRLALPHPLIQGFLATQSAKERPLSQRDFHRLERMVDIKLPIWIELGKLDIQSKELAKLEKGDVVLLEKVFVDIGQEGVEGPVTLRVQEGVGGGFRGSIVKSVDDKIAVEIQEVF